MRNNLDSPVVQTLIGLIKEIIPAGIQMVHVLVTKKADSVLQSVVAEYKLGEVNPTKIWMNCIAAFETMCGMDQARFSKDLSIVSIGNHTVVVHMSNDVNPEQRDNCANAIATKIKEQ